jgi:ribonuclease G
LNKELIIHSSANGVEIALLEDKKLVELHYDNTNSQFSVGDLYLGKVKKIMRGLNAVFVDIGHNKDAFLHYTDLSPNFKSLMKFTDLAQKLPVGKSMNFTQFELEPEIIKTGNINDVVKSGSDILVQVQKEPISSKGPRISCEVSLAGRFIVLCPFANYISISRKLANPEERKRLQRIIESIKPNNFGVIVRTAAEGQSTAELHKDMLELVANWENIQENLKSAKPPLKILGERSKTTSIIRDLLNVEFNGVITNDKEIEEEARAYIQKISPDKVKIIQYYDKDENIFEHYGINKQVKSSFGKTVLLANGGYLIIERTEACHVIDVNSGHKFTGDGQEDNSLQTNLMAAREIVRQIRLRDLGGILVIDFIDMKTPESRKVVQNEVEQLMSMDRARHTVLPISKFGLMQITRQRLRPEITIVTGESCPTCKGTGSVRSSELITDDIADKIEYITTTTKQKIEVHISPILHAYVTKGIFNSIHKKWNKQFDTKIKLVSEPHFEVLQYALHDQTSGEEIKM